MKEARSFGSLGPLLLARKGTARPAISAQAAALEDHGEEQDAEHPGPAPQRQQEEPPAAASSGGNDIAASQRRTAFTLRLDPERHLKLKLAAALEGCSAQQIMIRALDESLAGKRELASLAARATRD